MHESPYEPREYWNKVAKRIADRNTKSIIAGDDEPYYRYKRKKFLRLFHTINFRDKRVLEIGPGPGGNLLEALKHEPQELSGLDISEEMVVLAQQNLSGKKVTIEQLKDQKINFPENYFDLSFTSTVLQHTTDEHMLTNLVREICRVSRHDIYIFERIEKRRKGNELNMGRTVSEYEQLFGRFGFELRRVEFLDIHISYLTAGFIRKIFNRAHRREGERVSALSRLLQNITLPITSVLDKIFSFQRDLAMLKFHANENAMDKM